MKSLFIFKSLKSSIYLYGHRYRHISSSFWLNNSSNYHRELYELEGEPVDVVEEDIVRNPCTNVQMISDNLYKQVFTDVHRTRHYSSDLITKCKSHLKSHSLGSNEGQVIQPVSFQLPELEGISIDDHFRNIALQQTFKYRTLLDDLINKGIPTQPHEWVLQPGWTKYNNNGSCGDGGWTKVQYPEDDAYIFDIEVCVPNGASPTMACAVSTTSWYSWCSTNLCEGQDKSPQDRLTINDLIPFQNNQNEKLIVGHNVSYDRARIKEEYSLEGTKIRFIDTMSLHIAVSGITSFQRALKMSSKTNSTTKSASPYIFNAGSLEWNELSSLNNLKDVHKLYCPNDKELKKETRNIFVKGSIPEIKNDFQNLMNYCANDVKATYSILVKIIPTFYERFPHPVTLAGMLEMGASLLPINSKWNDYIRKSEETFKKLENEMKLLLVEKAEEALKLLPDEKYKNDPWLWNLDWSISKSRLKKDLNKKNQYPAWYKKLLYKETDQDYQPGPSKISTSMQIVPKLLKLCWLGFPLHYERKGGWGYLVKKCDIEDLRKESEFRNDEQQFLNFIDKNDDILDEDEELDSEAIFPYEEWEKIWEQNKIKIMEKLKVKFQQSRPVGEKNDTNIEVFIKELKNKKEDIGQDLSDLIKGLEALEGLGLRDRKKAKSKSINEVPSPHPKLEFRPLPHKDGANLRVGNPLSKDFLAKLEEGILSSKSGEDTANKVVRLSKMVSYWRNNKDRIMNQVTVWSDENEIMKLGAILPQVTIAGTLTRRAVEPTWLTASNAYSDRVGSELKAFIQAPPGYHFVGADVDSQELWIASIIGDAHFTRVHGSTALGWMTLQGNKSEGTDMHSKTASLIGIGRDQAKILNYGRIYGAGLSFAERLLIQFNPRLSPAEAKAKAKAIYKMTKGERKYLLNNQGIKLLSSIQGNSNRKTANNTEYMALTRSELYELANNMDGGSSYMDLVDKKVWDKGTESYMFNRLEEIAQSDCPTTPFLNCSISRSLVPSVVQDDFMTSRVNWVVQSSAVDYLHLMLTSMRWLFEKYKIQGRFSISVHDEVRYIVKSEDRYRAALALQITNLFTRALCSYHLGMDDLPHSVAFFSLVDIDKVLRKEVNQDCKTPSNPQGLELGHGIPFGEALDIYQILKLTNNGDLNKLANKPEV